MRQKIPERGRFGWKILRGAGRSMRGSLKGGQKVISGRVIV
jgi:hypothetical protein